MPFSERPIRVETVICCAVLMAGPLLTRATPARGDLEAPEAHRVSAAEIVTRFQGRLGPRDSLFAVDSRWSAPGSPLEADRLRLPPARFDDPDHARRAVAEEIVDGLERWITSGRWIPFRGRDPVRVGPEILFHLDDASPAPPLATESWRQRLRFSPLRGFDYRHEWATREAAPPLEMRIFGPVVSGGAGLGFQLKGRALDHRFRLNAYGSHEKTHLAIDFEF